MSSVSFALLAVVEHDVDVVAGAERRDRDAERGAERRLASGGWRSGRGRCLPGVGGDDDRVHDVVRVAPLDELDRQRPPRRSLLADRPGSAVQLQHVRADQLDGGVGAGADVCRGRSRSCVCPIGFSIVPSMHDVGPGRAAERPQVADLHLRRRERVDDVEVEGLFGRVLGRASVGNAPSPLLVDLVDGDLDRPAAVSVLTTSIRFVSSRRSERFDDADEVPGVLELERAALPQISPSGACAQSRGGTLKQSRSPASALALKRAFAGLVVDRCPGRRSRARPGSSRRVAVDGAEVVAHLRR